MKRIFRSALRPQLRSFEIPLCQAVCKMHSAREPHTGMACGIGREKQEKQQLPNASQEISVISRNWMLSLSPWPVVCYLFCHDQHRLMLVSRYWLERCKKSFAGVRFFFIFIFLFFFSESISNSVNRRWWPGCVIWGQAFSASPKKCLLEGWLNQVPVSKTAHVSWVSNEERRQSHSLRRVMPILAAPQKYLPLIWPELQCELKLSEMI